MLSRRVLLLLLSIFVTIPSFAFADQWDSQFGWASPFTPGIPNGPVYDMLVEGNDLYVVGDFTSIGGISASHVAKYDGSSWTALDLFLASTPSYVTPHAHRIVRYQQWLVVSGVFSSVNGQPGNAAFWDGNSWSGVQIGSRYGWYAMASDDSYLYLGGILDGPTDGIFRWSGTTQNLVTSGIWNVEALLSWNGSLYAGGFLHDLNGVVINNVGRWDGTTWNAMGNGIPAAPVLTFLTNNNELDAIASDGKAYMWTGTSWSSFTTPLTFACNSPDPPYKKGLFFQNHLYRVNVNQSSFHGIAKWNGVSWDNMNGGVTPGECTVAMTEYQGHLLVGGTFSTAGGFAAPGFARWENGNWLLRSPDAPVRSMTGDGVNVYVTGDFENTYQTTAHRIARFDGSSWHALGSGIDGVVNSAVLVNGDLYVGGEFTNAGGSGAVNLAKWNGVSWSPVGSPLNGPVYALATDGSNLYVGGSFVTYQNEYLQRIARWDGSTFHALGQGVRDGSVRAITIDGSNVCVGGDFSMIGNYDPSGNAAYYDGTWHTLGWGFYDGMVRDLEMHNGTLYAAGDFAVGGSLYHIARWNGTAWDGLPALWEPALNDNAYSMLHAGNSLFVVGDFTAAGGLPANHIAVWDGTSWSGLGSGLSGQAHALANTPGGISVGGSFLNAGGVASRYFGQWMLTSTAVTPTLTTRTSLEPIFPNPFNPTANIRYRVGAESRVTIAIYDVQGRRVRQLLDENTHASTAERFITWDGSTDIGTPVASGVYFVRMSARGYSETRKIVLLK